MMQPAVQVQVQLEQQVPMNKLYYSMEPQQVTSYKQVCYQSIETDPHTQQTQQQMQFLISKVMQTLQAKHVQVDSVDSQIFQLTVNQ